MKRLLFAMLGLCICSPASADIVVIYSAQITRVYAQSRVDSTAHLIQVNQTINTACHWNRIYIDFDDREHFATALAKHLANSTVDIVFETNATPKTAAGHAVIPCRVVSIF